MKIFYPAYYNSFKCIADKCSNSCCVGWEIGVDGDTANKYASLGGELGDEIRAHLCDDVIEMCDDGRCPFLDRNGLCRIISAMGEDYTSVICREHPRFYHRVGQRVEGGLGLSCEEACRIILSSDAYADFVEGEHDCLIGDETDFDSILHREYIYNILLNTDLSYIEKKSLIIGKYGLGDIFFTDDDFNAAFSELEYLDDDHRHIMLVDGIYEGNEYDAVLQRLMAYLVFRHVSIADGYDNLRARVGFCLLLCAVAEGNICRGRLDFAGVCDVARIISEEIEYSEDNTAALIFEMESRI